MTAKARKKKPTARRRAGASSRHYATKAGHRAIPLMRSALKAFQRKHAGDTSSLLESDFAKHDVAALAKRPTDSFAWFVGTSGTHLVWLDVDEPCPERLLSQVADTWQVENREIFFWDGVALRPFSSVSHLCSKLEDDRYRQETSRHATKKKTPPAQLQREIDEALTTRTEYHAHTGRPSWHQARAGHISSGVGVYSTREAAETYCANYRKHHPDSPCFVIEKKVSQPATKKR